MDSSSVINGQCNCGAVIISIVTHAFPSTCSLCHCLSCRASSGSLFAVNIPVPKESLEIKGTPKVFIDTGGSGKYVKRHFCGDCGSAIMSIMELNPTIAFVKGGLFRSSGVDLPRPNLQLWVRRAEPWEILLDGTKNIE